MFKFFFFIFIFFSFISCGDDITAVDILNVKTELGISLAQNVNSEGPFPEIIISTLDSINCKNSQLIVEESDFSDRIDIKVDGIVFPAQCVNGKVKLDHPINVEKLNQSKKLNIILKNSLQSNGNLMDNGAHYTIEFVDLIGFQINTTLINKIKPNTCWGVFSSNNVEDLEKIKNLLDIHKNKNFNPEIGNYGLFKYIGNKDIELSDKEFIDTTKSSYKIHNYIEYKNWDNFTNEVKKFKEQNPQIFIYLRNYQNKTLSI